MPFPPGRKLAEGSHSPKSGTGWLRSGAMLSRKETTGFEDYFEPFASGKVSVNTEPLSLD